MNYIAIEKRRIIRSSILDCESIDSNFIFKLYQLYDNYFFYGLLSSKVKSLIVIIKKLNSREVFLHESNLKTEKVKIIFNIRAFSNIIETYYEEDFHFLLLYLFEKVLINITIEFLSYGYELENQNINLDFIDIKTLENKVLIKLTECFSKKLYGYSNYIEMISSNIPKTGLVYYENSCYMDSLIMILLFSSTTFFKNKLFNPIISLSSINEYFGNMIYNINDVEKDIKFFSENFQDIYFNIDNTKNYTCKNIRQKLLDYLPLKYKERWIFSNPTYIYSLFSHFFDWNTKYTTSKGSKIKSAASFPFIDYLTDDEVIKINWDKIDSDILVFNNTRSPHITNFSKIGIEKGETCIGNDCYPFKIKKVRKFGEYILNGKYKLIGIIILLGTPKKGEGGSHYVCNFLGIDGNWYYYDDDSSIIKKIIKLNYSVWNDRGGKTPSMYFYEKTGFSSNVLHINNYNIIIKDLPLISSKEPQSELFMSENLTPILYADDDIKKFYQKKQIPQISKDKNKLTKNITKKRNSKTKCFESPNVSNNLVDLRKKIKKQTITFPSSLKSYIIDIIEQQKN